MLRMMLTFVLGCALFGTGANLAGAAPIYTTGGRPQPKFFHPSWQSYQNYRGNPGYNTRRRSDERRLPSPQYRATSTHQLYQY